MPTPARRSPPAARSNAKESVPSRHAERQRSSRSSWLSPLADGTWEAWQAYLTERPAPRPLAELTPIGISPLLWSVPHTCGDGVLRFLRVASKAHAADRHTLSEFAAWIEQELANSPTADPAAFSLTRLAWAHALPRLATVMTADAWRGVLQHLTTAADEAAAISLDHDPLGKLLLGGELPWTLAYLLHEIDECRHLGAAAATTLSEGLMELLDGEGVLAARHVGRLRPLLALWTRCGLIARELGRECFHRDARGQFSWLLQRAILLSRPDGGQLLSPGTEGNWCESLFEAALSLTRDVQDDTLARNALPLRASQRSAAVQDKRQAPAFHSEWAELSLLRPAATRSSPRLAVAFSQRRLLAELTNRDHVVFSGAWAPQIEVDGRRLTPQSEWEEVCWVSDEDLDYLELEISLSGGWRMQRQILLARKDEFLFAADAVLGASPAAIEYRCAAPLACGVAFIGEEQTRDGVLEGPTHLATVMPLALPEWRADRHLGALEMSGRGLELTMSATGNALFAPLVFDLSKRRFKKERTWRRLTVAERLQIQPPDVAVGYRVQVGKEQWLFYRSLAKAGNRTVLGQNFVSEFVAARFNAQGCVEEMISVSCPT